MKQPSIPFDLRDTREYGDLGFKIVPCPVCGKDTLNNHWICRSCGWEYDGITEEDVYSSCNKMTVANFRTHNL